ncbi:MAG: cytidylate kinase-like family protein [Chloroflexi bacterium]|nr:cytidylate kinase-like family protein [Chloroflexota bacterium]
MTAITISRQLGSLGTQVAEIVGEYLGYRVVWRELINEAGRRAGAGETALAAIDDLGLLGVRPSLRAHRAYRTAMAQVMYELVEAGEVIIVGRAGQAILHAAPCVLHARVIAPFDVRVERVATRHSVPQQAARIQVETSDRSRRDYLRRFYHVRWDDPELYDIVINTARYTAEAAADLICESVAWLKQRH